MRDETDPNTVSNPPSEPVNLASRFESLDVLRGFAVLGILMLNVQAFTMVSVAYVYPPAHMDLSGVNGLVWLYSHIFFEMKFITIFSALFGAGVILMVGEDKHASKALHFSRMRWLLVFGLIHMFALWFGDVLVNYAVAGFIVVFYRHMRPAKLIAWGLVWILLSGLFWFAMLGLFGLMPEEMRDPEAIGFAYDTETLAIKVEAYTNGYLSSRLDNAITGSMAIFSIVLMGGRIIGVMFLGMALFKLGFLTAKWSIRAYLASAVIGLGIGLPLVAIPAQNALMDGFPLETLGLHTSANYAASLFVAFGYASLVMIMCKLPILSLLRKPFAAAGRMAFTNYLTQTLIMVFLSVGGIGMGLFGQLERIEQVQLVLVIWLVQLIISPIWLSVFKFGPFEWLWRSLSYGRLQPFFKGK